MKEIHSPLSPGPQHPGDSPFSVSSPFYTAPSPHPVTPDAHDVFTGLSFLPEWEMLESGPYVFHLFSPILSLLILFQNAAPGGSVCQWLGT